MNSSFEEEVPAPKWVREVELSGVSVAIPTSPTIFKEPPARMPHKNIMGTGMPQVLFCQEGVLDKAEINEQDRFIRSAFDLELALGVGSFGQVFLGRSKTNGKMYAVKHLTRPYISKEDRMEARKEVEVLREVRHENIIGCCASFEQWDNLFIVMEPAPYSFQYALDVRRQLTVGEALRFGRDISSALKALHNVYVIHNDIKPSNVMCGADGRYKLIDFNIATYMEGHKRYKAETHYDPGEGYYLSERGLKVSRGDYERDFYAVGLTIFEAVRGKCIGGRDALNAFAQMTQAEIAAQLPQEAREDIGAAVHMLIMEKDVATQRRAAWALSDRPYSDADYVRLSKEEMMKYEEKEMQGQRPMRLVAMLNCMTVPKKRTSLRNGGSFGGSSSTPHQVDSRLSSSAYGLGNSVGPDNFRQGSHQDFGGKSTTTPERKSASNFGARAEREESSNLLPLGSSHKRPVSAASITPQRCSFTKRRFGGADSNATSTPNPRQARPRDSTPQRQQAVQPCVSTPKTSSRPPRSPACSPVSRSSGILRRPLRIPGPERSQPEIGNGEATAGLSTTELSEKFSTMLDQESKPGEPEPR